MYTTKNSKSQKSLFKISLLAILFSLTFLTGINSNNKNLNLKAKNQNDLTVHIVPHTHDDAGWNWTFDEYYYGSGTCNVSVKNILDNFVQSLYDRKDRTFIYVETGFFVRWYKDQPEDIKQKVKNLLAEKRFEFINGGYVMHDEAASYYQHSIDQMRLGLLFLKEEFDFVPEIAWFIDPFGHSASNAYVLSKMGFKKIAIVRIDSTEKEQRKQKKSLEFYWVPFNKFDDTVKIFTHVTWGHYCPPGSLDSFDQDNSKNLNILEKFYVANQFVKEMKMMSDSFRHKHIMVMYGCDFTFNKRGVNYENVESVMDFINYWKILGYKTNVKYSTPSKYFEEIFENVENWPSYENEDFFPYADSGDSIWTGYFTSRPYLKGMVREAGNYLIVASKMLFKFIYHKNSTWNRRQGQGHIENSKELIDEAISKIFTLREKLAICQHHDAVAGTAREYVSQDYINMLESAVNESKESFQNFTKKFFGENSKNYICIDPVVDFKCLENQMKNFDENEKLLLKISGRRNQTENLSENLFRSFEINEENFVEKNEESEFDTFCVNELRNKTQNCKVYFKNQNKFVIQKKSEEESKLKYLEDTDKNFNAEKSSNENEKIYLKNFINNGEIKLTENLFAFYSKEENSLKLKISTNQNTYNFTVYHAFYESYNGENSDLRPNNSCPSGAYILSTTKVDFDKFEMDGEKSYFEKGDLVSRVVLRFEKSYLILTMDNQRPYAFAEIESIWDPIPEDAKALEYLLIVDSDVDNLINLPSGKSEPEFWTDSNGIKMMRRIKDFRSGFDFPPEDPVSANFYPVNSMFSIREKDFKNYTTDEYQGLTNENRMISYMVDRSESIGGMKKGQFIVIQNRQSYADDRKGMQDGLLKEASSFRINFKVKSYLIFDNNISLIKEVEKNIQNRFAIFTSIVNKEFTTKDHHKRSHRRKSGVEKKRFLNNFFNNFSAGNKNVVMSVHILTEKKIFLQFFNNCDIFHDRNCQKADIELIEKEGMRFTEYKFNGVSPLNMENLKERNVSAELNPFDFKLFLVEFVEN